ncbi:MAG: TrbC/VirB2 family protein [Patescibacteria group bacterium]
MSKFLAVAKKWSPAVLVALILFSPLTAFAAPNTNGVGPIEGGALTKEDLINVVESVVTWLIFIGIAIAVLYIVIAGFQYLFAGGDSEKAGKARTHLWNGLIGLLIIVGAFIIVKTVVGLVESFLFNY